MRSIALALLFFLLPGLGNAAEPALPDLLFLTGSSFGGYGRLVFSESAGRYQLLDGRIITHVVDGQQIRLMRADEGGGSMANPTKVVALDGKLFGNSTYGQLNELDPVTGAIGEKYSIGPFGFGASGSTAALFASDKALLIFERGKLIALDSRLKKLGEKSLEQAPRHVMLSPEFAQEGDKLHNVVIDNPNAYTHCAGGCNFPTVIRHMRVDFSNPADIRITSHEEPVEKPPFHALRVVVDSGHQGWFMVKTSFGASPPAVAFHSFSRLAVPAAEIALPEGASVAAATQTAPFWLVLEQRNSGPRLARVSWNGKELTLSTFDLDWLKGSSHTFALASDADRLYVAAGHQLAVYDASAATPRLIVQQDFVSPFGSSQFQIGSLLPVSLARPSLAANRTRLETELAKDNWHDRDHLAIQAEIDKLKPSDTWAIALFTELLKKRQQSYHGGIGYAVKALTKFGTAAAAAVPNLIYSAIEGSAIRGDALALVIAAIAKIDPQGSATRAMLPDCIKKTYVCEHVGKKVLAGPPK
ncbi:MAG: PQQ-like beta-propeller repeat protein [Deltaproteobacteria bacterium]|nr:PQQ-like beta-propeller repeat protein [Deltaproteobacteria bacterium]